jgi:hypothetical protein
MKTVIFCRANILFLHLFHHFPVRKIFLIILSSLALSSIAQGPIIVWDEKTPLKYEDFIGPVPGDKLDHQAVTFSVIEIKFEQTSGSVKVNVLSYFKKDLSWMRNSAKNSYTLRHEQGHFDITEIHARKIRKKLSGMRISRKTGDKKVTKICKKYIEQHHKAQKTYDKATSFSIREKNQKKWTAKLAAQLKKLDAYKSSEVGMKLK